GNIEEVGRSSPTRKAGGRRKGPPETIPRERSLPFIWSVKCTFVQAPPQEDDREGSAGSRSEGGVAGAVGARIPQPTPLPGRMEHAGAPASAQGAPRPCTPRTDRARLRGARVHSARDRGGGRARARAARAAPIAERRGSGARDQGPDRARVAGGV